MGFLITIRRILFPRQPLVILGLTEDDPDALTMGLGRAEICVVREADYGVGESFVDDAEELLRYLDDGIADFDVLVLLRDVRIAKFETVALPRKLPMLCSPSVIAAAATPTYLH